MAHKSKSSSIKLSQRVLEAATEFNNATFNYRQIAAALGMGTPKQHRAVALVLAELAFDGNLIEVAPGKYKQTVRGNTAMGTFVRRSNGKNSVVIDGDGEPIFVAERNSMHVLNGDRVRVNIAAGRRGAEPEAEVLEIVEKKDQTFIGTIVIEGRGKIALLNTDSKFLANDIFIPTNRLKGGKDGDKAVVKITNWPDNAKNPWGEVVDILGKKGENNTEIHAILAEYGLPYRYPEAVERAAAKIDAGITPEVVAQREDMRSVTTFTIDPKDAKDFDDALSCRQLKNGHWEVGVHIADVTHYVHPDTIIDREAQQRATSVYLVDRVVPMLPEHLSNGICSLRPNEDKLTFSCVFEMDRDARIVNYRIARTVTRSDRRFTYEEAQEVIETGKGDFAEEILTLDRLAKTLRQRRYENGSVDFDREEVRFEIDKDGHPLGVYFKVSKDSNKLIEEFMLLANRTVAQHIGQVPKGKREKAFVYRVHDMPDPGKLEDLSKLARTFGFKVRPSGTPREVNKSINRMLADVKGRGEENFLSTLAIRSMAKAVYTTDNIGHYGLGFDYYTHFTSPIRRYPDMMVHRLLERYLHGGRSVNREKLQDQCKHSSDMEQLAANAERSSIKYKQIEYMGDHLGQTYEGMISGVTEWGLYVELNENKCEGLVPVRDLADDYYDFDEKNYCLIGRRRGNRYRLGDTVMVRVARINLDKKQLDFVLIDDRHPLQNPREDEMGHKVSIAQALSNTPIRKVPKSSKKSPKKSTSKKSTSKKSTSKKRR